MIYKNNFTRNNKLPQNIQICLDEYKSALENFALNDYKMRLNANNRDSHGAPNVTYRNAMGDRSNNAQSMRESIRAAFIFARDEANMTENISIIDKVQYEFHSIVSDSIFNGSNACQFEIEGYFGDSQPYMNIEDSFRMEIDNAYNYIGKRPKVEEQTPLKNDDDISLD